VSNLLIYRNGACRVLVTCEPGHTALTLTAKHRNARETGFRKPFTLSVSSNNSVSLRRESPRSFDRIRFDDVCDPRVDLLPVDVIDIGREHRSLTRRLGENLT